MNRLHPRRLFACLLALCWAAPSFAPAQTSAQAAPAPQAVAASNYIALPLSPGSQGQPMLQAEINGKKALIYVDTGAPVMCVDESKSRRYNLGALAFGEERKPLTVNANGAGHLVTLISSLRAGGLHLENTPAVLIDFREINRVLRGSRDRPNDAIMGLEILTGLGAILDFESGRLLVKTGATQPGAFGAKLRAGGWTEIPMHLNEGHLAVRVVVNKTPTEFIVDTGSPTSVLDREFCKAHDVPLSRRMFSSRGIHFQDASVQVGKIASLKVGAYRINDLPVAVFDLSRLLGLARNTKAALPDGLIGCETLVRHHGQIDCENMKLYLR
jgi:predicted aspartyl protease